MTPVQIGVLHFTIATILVAWIKGGHPERLGACAVLIWVTTLIAAPAWLSYVMVGEVPLFDVALELALLAVLVRMALKGDRWWPFAASAVAALSVLVYPALAFVPEFDRRAEISAHVGLVVALDLAMLAGVGERWLAGERPVSAGDSWRGRKTRP
jgi:hypothetical protein